MGISSRNLPETVAKALGLGAAGYAEDWQGLPRGHQRFPRESKDSGGEDEDIWARNKIDRKSGLKCSRIHRDGNRRYGDFHDLLPVVLSVSGESQGDSDRVNLQGRRDDVVEFTRAVGDDSSKYHRPHRQADHGLHYGRFQTERFCGSGSRRVLSVQVVPGLTGRCRIYPPASQEQW
ncbi:hypothetical protein MTP99_011520 [Tenebrio molitor]|nr:hypothetical protein MTP99_011520 [Tenebrio molitor]